jgi:hypothetical protein
MSELRKGVRKGTRISGASCMDITPTILQLYGMCAPDSLKGRVIKELAGEQALGSLTASESPPLPGVAFQQPHHSTPIPETELGGRGRCISAANQSPDRPPVAEQKPEATVGFTTEEEEEVKKRLAELGYI